MPETYNNRKLILFLAGLAIVAAIAYYYQSRSSKSSFSSDLPGFDSAAVTTILITPKSEKGAEVIFSKTDTIWSVSKGNISATPRQGIAESMISELKGMKVLKVASRKKEKWNEYEVGDSAASHVILKSGDQTLFDIFIGKFDFERTQMGGGQFGQGGISGSTYIRLGGEDVIYVVEGFISFTFNSEFKNWRDGSFIKTERQSISKISFTNSGDSSFVLEKSGNGWMVNGKKADSSSVEEYLSALSFRDYNEFYDLAPPPGAATCILNVETGGMVTLSVEGWESSPGQFILRSSLNPKALFTSPVEGIYKEVFVSGERFK